MGTQKTKAKKGLPKNLKYEMVSVDTGDLPEFILGLRKALRPLGLHVYRDPALKGYSQEGVIISKQKLTYQQLHLIDKEEWI